MEDTKKSIIRLLVITGSLILLYLLVIFVASVVQIAEAADRVYLGLGQPVFLALMLFFVTMTASPLYLYFRFPRALTPPPEAAGPEFDKYMVQLRERLRKNHRLNGRRIETDEEVKAALSQLSKEAENVIRNTAKNVFFGTAISQNGRLDGLITLATQGKMVWQIACIYSQRPSPREMLYLYSNVAASALLADSIDDIDFSEVIAPLLSSIGMGGLAAVPGASVIMNSMSSGASNAFLTLRVGHITNQYCESIIQPNRAMVRREATIAAATQVSTIVKENSEQLLSAIWNVVKKTTGNVATTIKDTASKTADSISESATQIGGAVGNAFDGVKVLAGQTVSTVSLKLEAAGSSVGEAIDETKLFSEKTAKTLSETAGSIAEATGGAYKDIKNVTAKATDATSQRINSLGVAVGGAMESVKKSTESANAVAKQKAEPIVESINISLGGLKGLAGNASKTVSETAKSTGNAIGSLIEKAKGRESVTSKEK